LIAEHRQFMGSKPAFAFRQTNRQDLKVEHAAVAHTNQATFTSHKDLNAEAVSSEVHSQWGPRQKRLSTVLSSPA